MRSQPFRAAPFALLLAAVCVPPLHAASLWNQIAVYRFSNAIGKNLAGAINSAERSRVLSGRASNDIEQRRRAFFNATPGTPAYDEAERSFAKALLAKDMLLLTRAIPEGPYTKRADVLRRVLGNVDGGVKRDARPAFNKLVIAIREHFGARNHGEHVGNPDLVVITSSSKLRDALIACEQQYRRYVLFRDYAEFKARGRLKTLFATPASYLLFGALAADEDADPEYVLGSIAALQRMVGERRVASAVEQVRKGSYLKSVRWRVNDLLIADENYYVCLVGSLAVDCRYNYRSVERQIDFVIDAIPADELRGVVSRAAAEAKAAERSKYVRETELVSRAVSKAVLDLYAEKNPPAHNAGVRPPSILVGNGGVGRHAELPENASGFDPGQVSVSGGRVAASVGLEIPDPADPKRTKHLRAVHLFDAATGKRVGAIAAPAKEPLYGWSHFGGCIALDGPTLHVLDGQLLLSPSGAHRASRREKYTEGVLLTYDTASGRLLRSFRSPSQGVSYPTRSRTKAQRLNALVEVAGDRLLAATSGKFVRTGNPVTPDKYPEVYVIRKSTGALERTLRYDEWRYFGGAVASGPGFVAIAAQDGQKGAVLVYDAAVSKLLRTIDLPEHGKGNIELSAAGTQLLVSSAGPLTAYDALTGKRLYALQSLEPPYFGSRFFNNWHVLNQGMGNDAAAMGPYWLVSGARSVVVYSRETGKQVARLVHSKPEAIDPFNNRQIYQAYSVTVASDGAYAWMSFNKRWSANRPARLVGLSFAELSRAIARGSERLAKQRAGRPATPAATTPLLASRHATRSGETEAERAAPARPEPPAEATATAEPPRQRLAPLPTASSLIASDPEAIKQELAGRDAAKPVAITPAELPLMLASFNEALLGEHVLQLMRQRYKFEQRFRENPRDDDVRQSGVDPALGFFFGPRASEPDATCKPAQRAAFVDWMTARRYRAGQVFSVDIKARFWREIDGAHAMRPASRSQTKTYTNLSSEIRREERQLENLREQYRRGKAVYLPGVRSGAPVMVPIDPLTKPDYVDRLNRVNRLRRVRENFDIPQRWVDLSSVVEEGRALVTPNLAGRHVVKPDANLNASGDWDPDRAMAGDPLYPALELDKDALLPTSAGIQPGRQAFPIRLTFTVDQIDGLAAPPQADAKHFGDEAKRFFRPDDGAYLSVRVKLASAQIVHPRTRVPLVDLQLRTPAEPAPLDTLEAVTLKPTPSREAERMAAEARAPAPTPRVGPSIDPALARELTTVAPFTDHALQYLAARHLPRFAESRLQQLMLDRWRYEKEHYAYMKPNPAATDDYNARAMDYKLDRWIKRFLVEDRRLTRTPLWLGLRHPRLGTDAGNAVGLFFNDLSAEPTRSRLRLYEREFKAWHANAVAAAPRRFRYRTDQFSVGQGPAAKLGSTRKAPVVLEEFGWFYGLETAMSAYAAAARLPAAKRAKREPWLAAVPVEDHHRRGLRPDAYRRMRDALPEALRRLETAPRR
ncbi:MAG: hypothetical protein AAF790_11110, partial [Planctomycetota bacterium]